MNIKQVRSTHTWSRQKLDRARRLYITLVESGLRRCRTDRTRRELLWRCASRAIGRGLWKAPIAKNGYSKSVCYSLLSGMHRKVKVANDPFSWHKWLDSNGWMACGQESLKYENKRLAG